VSITKGSPKLGEDAKPSQPYASVTEDSLRGLYVQTSISRASRAAELGRFLNIDETTFATPKDGRARDHGTTSVPHHESDVTGPILDAVVADSKADLEYLHVPEPVGGVQQWWARMLIATPSHSRPESPDHSTLKVTAS
jgi:hypothetical protein